MRLKLNCHAPLYLPESKLETRKYPERAKKSITTRLPLRMEDEKWPNAMEIAKKNFTSSMLRLRFKWSHPFVIMDKSIA